ncbi:MAG: hypothetical protein V2I51_12285 [Anderseniella sp.]|nr:hypothetical protein [Anderseniella sp.]
MHKLKITQRRHFVGDNATVTVSMVFLETKKHSGPLDRHIYRFRKVLSGRGRPQMIRENSSEIGIAAFSGSNSAGLRITQSPQMKILNPLIIQG